MAHTKIQCHNNNNAALSYISLIETLFLLPPSFGLQEGECEVDLELEGEAEGVCEAEEAYELGEEEEEEEEEDYPAVIVEDVPGASLAGEQGYSAQVLVYGDEAYLMQEVEAEGEAGESCVFLYLLDV